jgi:hypothetical protein
VAFGMRSEAEFPQPITSKRAGFVSGHSFSRALEFLHFGEMPKRDRTLLLRWDRASVFVVCHVSPNDRRQKPIVCPTSGLSGM